MAARTSTVHNQCSRPEFCRPIIQLGYLAPSEDYLGRGYQAESA
jgi:hypothetical protein